MVTIYLIQHKPSGRGYVGRTKRTARERFDQHVQIAEYFPLQITHKALTFFGPENFEVLEVAVCPEDQAAQFQKDAISALGTSWPRGFNVRPCSMRQMRASWSEARLKFQRLPGAAETGTEGEP